MKTISLNKAEKFFLQPVISKTNGRNEPKSSLEKRIEWKEAGFPLMKIFAKEKGYKIKTIEKYSAEFGWQRLRDEYFRLLSEIKAEENQNKIDEMEEEYSEIWKKLRESIKSCIFDLNDKILDSADEKEIKQIFNDYAVLIRNLDTVQKAERLNFRLPNSYKETEKLELKQSGELNIGLSDETVNLFEKIKEMRKEEQEQ